MDDRIERIERMLRNNSFDEKEFYEIMLSYHTIPIIPLKLPKGSKITRCSSNKDNAFHTNIARLNYPPCKKSVPLARANRIEQQMFYGTAFCTFNEGEEKYALPPFIVSAFETSHLFNEYERTGRMFTTESTWRPTKTLSLMILPHSVEWKHPSKELLMIKDFINNDEAYKNAFSDEQKKIGCYFGDLFAKMDYSCLYEITSRVAEYLLFKSEYALDFDGIAYPSTKSDGNGMNVCLKPSVVDEYIEFQSATLWKIERNERILFEPLANSIHLPGGELKWSPNKIAINELIDNYGIEILNDPSIIYYS